MDKQNIWMNERLTANKVACVRTPKFLTAQRRKVNLTSRLSQENFRAETIATRSIICWLFRYNECQENWKRPLLAVSKNQFVRLMSQCSFKVPKICTEHSDERKIVSGCLANNFLRTRQNKVMTSKYDSFQSWILCAMFYGSSEEFTEEEKNKIAVKRVIKKWCANGPILTSTFVLMSLQAAFLMSDCSGIIHLFWCKNPRIHVLHVSWEVRRACKANNISRCRATCGTRPTWQTKIYSLTSSARILHYNIKTHCQWIFPI